MKIKPVSLDVFAHNLQRKMNANGLSNHFDLADYLKQDELFKDITSHRCKRWLEAKTFPQHKIMVPLMAKFGISNYQQFLTEKI